MNLISCAKCGVIIDTNRIAEPDMEREDGGIDTDKALWHNRDYVPAIICPVCKTLISYKTGEF
jgi:hypothetical protein